MTTTDPRRWLALASLALLAGCADSEPTGFIEDRILDQVQLDAAQPTSDYEFRICKVGVPTEEEAHAEIRLTAVESGGSDAEPAEVVVRQWATKQQFEDDEPSTLVARGMAGDRIVGDMRASVPLTTAGSQCGPWSVFRIELEQPAQGTVVSVDGAFVVEFFDDAAPLEDFRVEMPDW